MQDYTSYVPVCLFVDKIAKNYKRDNRLKFGGDQNRRCLNSNQLADAYVFQLFLIIISILIIILLLNRLVPVDFPRAEIHLSGPAYSNFLCLISKSDFCQTTKYQYYITTTFVNFSRYHLPL